MAKLKSVDDIDVEELAANAQSLFAEIVREVRVPEPLVVVPGVLVAKFPPARRVTQLLSAITIDDQIRAVFGDDYEVAEKLFGEQPIGVWNNFMERYNKHMFGDEDSGK